MKSIPKTFLRTFILCVMSVLITSSAFAQNLTGKVVDHDGVELIGASVMVKGASTGSITDLNGRFSVKARAGQTLVVSYIGYLTKEVAAAQGMTITLEEDNHSLDDVVVIGYGSVKRKDATGSVETLSADPKLKGVAPNATDMLVGKIAGVQVTTAGGSANAGASIRIRGGSSLSASNDPLVIIDGVYMEGGRGGMGNPLSTINPNDIEDFTVLKDASATAIYGSRASNGVILITTKKGKSGKMKITYDGNVSVSRNRKKVDVLDGDGFRAMIAQKFAGASNEADVLARLGDANTDWQDQIFRTAVSTDHAISMYGSAGDFMPYRVSLGYTNNNGILKTDHMERYTAGVSATPSFFDNHLKFNLNAKLMHSYSQFANGGAIGSSLYMDPTQPVYAAEGSEMAEKFGGYWAWTGEDGNVQNYFTKNPVAMLEQHEDRWWANNFIGNAQVDYDFFYVPGLRATLNLSLDYYHSHGHSFETANSQMSVNTLGWHNQGAETRRNQMLDYYMTYNRDLKAIQSHFDVMAGYSWQRYWVENPSHNISSFVYDNDNNLVPSQEVFSNYPTQHYIVSFFGRANYSLMDRYLLTFTMRRDGSSRFSQNNHWGTFPSLAFAWRAIEESWFKNQQVLSNLKLRLGWGKTGQQDINQGDYPFLGSYIYSINSQSSAWRNGQWSLLLQPNAYNGNLKWETTTTYNVGVDFGFFRNRVTGSIDAYLRKTTDLINAEAKVPAGVNFAEYVASNIGDLENRGIEIAINTIPVQTKDWTWNLGANFSWNKNKITKLSNGGNAEATERRFFGTSGDGSQYLKVHKVGQTAGMWYMYEQVYDEQGKPLEGVFVDRNNDGVINEGDLRTYHHATPDYTIGLNSKLQWKNWDLDIASHGAFGGWIYNSQGGGAMSTAQLFANQFLTNRTLESVKNNFDTNKVLSDYWVRRADYFRIDNITLGYSFSKIAKVKASGRVYATVQNPFVFTPYDGLDPEIDGGYDSGYYPRPVSFLFGVNLNF